MTTNQRYLVLLLTTVLSVTVILLVELLLLNFKIFERPSWHWFGMFGAAAAIIALLATCKPLSDLTTLPLGVIELDKTIWLLYLVDLVALTYLMATSGGLSGSPYGSFLTLLPTNGIIMEQNASVVKKYYLGIIPPVIGLTLFCPDQAIEPDKLFVYKGVYLAVFVLMLTIAWIGYSARDHTFKNTPEPKNS